MESKILVERNEGIEWRLAKNGNEIATYGQEDQRDIHVEDESGRTSNRWYKSLENSIGQNDKNDIR